MKNQKKNMPYPTRKTIVKRIVDVMNDDNYKKNVILDEPIKIKNVI